MILIRLKQHFSNFKIEIQEKINTNGLYLFGRKKECVNVLFIGFITLVHKISNTICLFPQINSFYKQIFKEFPKHKELKNALTDLENSLNIKFKRRSFKIIMIFLISVYRIKKENTLVLKACHQD